ncbi:MAG: SRPBCC family protein [Flavisolibacter sp.]|nr:SRPBCC family protein [Flavisolibacter sp.]MBD0378105.1 SRPBCC family protein [Flavisolibacter sp.]
MAANDYVFVDHFTAPCDPQTAYHYISRIEEYPRWWGTVYKKITKLNEVPEGQPGARYTVTVGGFLPYTLTMQNEVVHLDKPNRIEFNATGDLEGKGVWTFEKTEAGTKLTFDWRVLANKKVIRWFSFLLKPLFRANHVYCVRKAKEGMTKDLMGKQPFSTSL